MPEVRVCASVCVGVSVRTAQRPVRLPPRTLTYQLNHACTKLLGHVHCAYPPANNWDTLITEAWVWGPVWTAPGPARGLRALAR